MREAEPELKESIATANRNKLDQVKTLPIVLRNSAGANKGE